MSIVQQSQVLLIASLVINLVAIVHIARRGDDGFRIRLLLLVNYMIDNTISGIVHVWHISKSRGFYEAMAGAPTGQGTGLLTASWAALLGIIGLWIGVLPRRRRDRHGDAKPVIPAQQLFSVAASRRNATLVVGAVMIAICGASWAKVVSSVGGSGTRIIAVSGGMARYVILSGWLQWGVTLFAMAILSRRGKLGGQVWNALVMLLSVGLIVITMSWSGGRSSLLFAIMPLLAMVLPWTGKVKWPMLGVGIASLGGFIWYETLQRASKSAGSTDIAGLIDWQWGRFSMGAWAARYVQIHGSVHGETFLSSLIAVPNAILHFVGMQLPFHLHTMVQLTGESFLGSSDMIYIVPGFTAELILNFGLIGVVVGYLVLGLTATVLADWFQNTAYELERVLIVFIATTICFSTIVSAAEAFFLGIVMDGLPLFMLVAWERIDSRRAMRQAGTRTIEASFLRSGRGVPAGAQDPTVTMPR